jgi:hypothetical protein
MSAIDLQTDEAGRLVLVDEAGNRHVNLKPLRVFPLTEPNFWISLQSAEGVEMACIEDPATLSETARAALTDALAKRDFVPIIRAIHRIVRVADGHQWHVTTDRGPTVFRIENDESMQNLGGSRLVIIDDHNTRYLIPNISALDRDSQRKLERFY